MSSRLSGNARTTLVFSCAALALIGGFAWWLLHDDGGGSRPQLVAPKDVVTAEAPLAAPVDAQKITAAREEVETIVPVVVTAGLDLELRPPPESFLRELSGLRGRLIEEDGTPVPNLKVDLIQLEFDLAMATIEGGFGKPPPRFREPIVGTTTSGADGAFLLRDVESSNIMLLGIDLGGGRGLARLVEATFARGQQSDLGDIVMPPHITLTGKVEDEDGAPVAGARVRVLPEMPVPIPPQILQMGITDIRSDGALLISAQGITTHFAMPAPLRFIFEHLPLPTATTADDGTYRVAGVPAGLVTIMADHPGHVGTARAQPTGRRPESSVSTLMLTSGRVVEGQVVAGETPIDGANMWIGSTLPLGELLGAIMGGMGGVAGVGMDEIAVAVGQPSPPTDSAGNFKLRGLPEFGEVMCAVQRRAGDPWSIHGPFAASTKLKIELPAETTLQIAVQDAASKPVSGVDFRFREKLPADEMAFLFEPHELKGRISETAPGRYVARELPPGKWDVLARAPGYGIGSAQVELAPEGATVVITLGGAASLTAHVTDAATGAPIDYAVVTALATVDSAHVTPFTAGRTDAEGNATLQTLPVNQKLALRVRHPGYTRAYAKVTPEQLTAGAPIAIALLRGGDLVGRVMTEGEPPGKPLMLVVSPRDGIDNLPESEIPRFGLSAPDGNFSIRHLASGKWKYMVYGRFLTEPAQALIKRMATDAEPDPLAEGEFEIVEGQETRLDIEAMPDVPSVPATLRGTVRVAGERVAKAQIQLSGRRWSSAECDDRGEFTIENLRPGRYQVNIHRANESGQALIHRESFMLGSGEVRQLDVDARLTPQAVIVRLADGGAAGGVQLQAIAQQAEDENSYWGGSSIAAQTNEKGEAQLELVPGQYKLIAYSEEFGRGRGECEVGSVAGKEIEIVLLAGIPCTGRVVCEGVDLPAANADPESGVERWHLYVSPADRSNEESSIGNDRWMQLEPPEMRFELKNAVPGRYQAMLWVTDNDGQRNLEFEIPERGVTDLVLRFPKE
ncbi:MAG: carboxypeptidase regulatory-like domain-containing protein [Planctomycetes bacterium]|nr:carboxypeptidase regulatory-like domain-containing protein [Planctomycetota bacterium]